MWSRRELLRAAAGVAALAGAPRLVWAATADDGFRVLRAKGGVAPLMGDKADPTAIWGFNGKCPGPILKVRQGEVLKVRLVNELLEPTSIHWHGIRLSNAMDGTELTQEPVPPGGTFDYVFEPPDAGTFWYHAHVGSAQQVDRGLYGALIVEEETPPEGMSDVVMVIDDWWLLESGAINEEAFGDLMVAAHGGRMGNWLTVNGISRPHLTAPAGKRLRVRLINAANARLMRLLFNAADPHLLAIDGQPLASPRLLAGETVVLPPGGRADIGLRRGTEQVTVAIDIGGEPVDLALIERKDVPEAVSGTEGDEKLENVGAQPVPDAGEFAPLPANPLPEALDLSGALAVKLVMEGGAMGGMKGAILDGSPMAMGELVEHGMAWAMNGVAGLPQEPLVAVERGRTVALTIDNRTAWNHALHLHGHHVRVMEDNGGAGADSVWRDTVPIEPQAIVTVAFIADNPGKWIIECNVLEHGEAGMMTWFEVT